MLRRGLVWTGAIRALVWVVVRTRRTWCAAGKRIHLLGEDESDLHSFKTLALLHFWGQSRRDWC